MCFESPFCTALDLNINPYYISLILPFMSFIFCTCMSRRLLSFGGQGLFSSVNFYTNVYFYHLFFIKYYTFNSGYLKKKFNRLTYIVILKVLFLWVTKSFVQHNCVYDSLYGCLNCIGFMLYLLILWYFSWCWSQFCLIFGYIFTEYSKNWECSTFLVTVQMHFFSILFYSLLMTLFLFNVYTPTIWLELTL